MDSSPLDRVMWLAFDGPQRHFTVGNHRARRFAPGFSPIILFPDRTRPDFDAIAPHCQSGEQFYVEGWNGAAPAGWRIDSETPMVLMVFGEPSVLPEAPSFGYRRLSAADVPLMLDLKMGFIEHHTIAVRVVEKL